jgi:hypothetical protein
MSILRCLNNDKLELEIQNRVLSAVDELHQAVLMLLRVDSPYATLLTCAYGVMGTDRDSAESDIKMRLKNIETLLKKDYGIQKMVIENMVFNEETELYDIDIIIQDQAGKIRKVSVNA